MLAFMSMVFIFVDFEQVWGIPGFCGVSVQRRSVQLLSVGNQTFKITVSCTAIRWTTPLSVTCSKL